jgi:hypothetical protein
VGLVVSTVYSVYAVEAESIGAARATVETALRIDLALHDSAYLGEYFRATESDGEELELQANHHIAEDAWLEPEHLDAPYLLLITSPAGRESWRADLERHPRIRPLRRTEH